MSSASRPSTSRPGATAGIGLRAPHYQDLLERGPAIGWLEVHSENYFGCGGMPAHFLGRVRERWPLSFHGVGLSLGSTDPLDHGHLRALGELVARFEPELVSDHLCWTAVGGHHFNDLLPLPYTEEALALVTQRVGQVQDALGRQLLVENPSSYLEFTHSTIAEPEFLVELARRSGCALLLDVNNVFVSSHNHGWDADAYLRAIPGALVREVHLAGHSANRAGGRDLLIDTHNCRVSPPVWDLFARAVALWGPRPSLIEWDSDLPPLEVLLDEARIADGLLADPQEALHARAA